jgi:UDP-GlcNAc:undecaprenyl-phosphate/decaprenyl-phosphate GlcNAc-1-phosphate transferase
MIMGSSWAIAFLAAAAMTLLTTPLFRQLARRVGLVDKPAGYKAQPVPVPYLGGLAVAFGTLTGILLMPGEGSRFGAVALLAAGLCAIGLLDDDRTLSPSTRLAVEVIAAVATLALGLRFEVTGNSVMDGALTVVWIVGLTNAANLLDNMDGLGAGVAASIAGSTLFLALGRGGQPIAALAAAVLGACLGFLVYNRRPASVYMGDAGSLFLGYLLAVLTLAATQSLPASPRFVVPLMLASVPLADTTTVVMARLRRGIRPTQAGRDHLSHRLVRRGLAPGPAIAVLVTTSLLVGMLGSLAGRGTLPLSTAIGAAGIVLGLLLRTALPGSIYDTPANGLPGWVLLVGATGVAGAALAWQRGLVPIGASGNAVPFHAPSAGLTPTPLVLVGAAFITIGVALLTVVRHRRQSAPLVLPAHSVGSPIGRGLGR